MRILGISLDDTSSAALFVEDRIVAAVSEERFSRIKRDERFPLRAIDYCLNATGLRGGDLDAVVLGTPTWDFWRWLTHYHSGFSIDDFVLEQEGYWWPKLHEREKPSWPKLFRNRWDVDQFPSGWAQLANRFGNQLVLTAGDRAKAENHLDIAVSKHLGIRPERILRVSSSVAHASYAYWSSPFRGTGSLAIMLDADAGGTGTSVSLPGRFGLLQVSSQSSAEFALGKMMRAITLMLGLPPRDHDPVLMGMAAHAPARAKRKIHQAIARLFRIDAKGIRLRVELEDFYFHFLDLFKGVSDDELAGGVQSFAEDAVSVWLKNVTRATQAKRIAVSGSLSMNHRIMERIAELRDVEDVFVPPASGQGALALGACYHVATTRYGATPRPLQDAWLGPDIGAADVRHSVEELSSRGHAIVESPQPELIAKLLSGGAVLGRCAGRAEFGSRGLGNRSILCDPRSPAALSVVGAKIKGREPFVPFSPTILASEAHRYIKNPKAIQSRFMNLAYRTTSRGRKELAAAVNAADGSVRPQFLEDHDNLGFAAILRAFQARTGVPALLNTSLNLRGEPMALSSDDAVRVFEKTSLDFLLLGDILIGKRGASLRHSGSRRRRSVA